MNSIEEARKEFLEILNSANNHHIQNNLNESLVQDLINMCVIRLVPHTNGARPEDWQKKRNYLCMEHFVLANGCFFKGRKLPKEYKKGGINQCFYNSWKGINEYSDIQYVEGYAKVFLPMQHAWNIDSHGVVDLTLKDNPIKPAPWTDLEYFGIVFNPEFINETIFKRMKKAKNKFDCSFTIIDYWEDGWPLLRDKKLEKEAIVPPSQTLYL